MEEQSVIAAVRNGDQRTFAWLVRRYEHMLFTICDRVLRNREETEEAAQDAFVKAYQNMASYAGEAKFSTWLYSIAFRTAISKLRSRKGGSVDLADVPESVASTWDVSPPRNIRTGRRHSTRHWPNSLRRMRL